MLQKFLNLQHEINNSVEEIFCIFSFDKIATTKK